MTERLTDEQLRAELAGAREVLSEYDKLVDSLRARVTKLEVALESIADTYDDGWRAGSQERRIGDAARAALKDAPR